MGQVEMKEGSIRQRQLKDDTLVIIPGKTLDNNNAYEVVDIITTAQARGFRYIIMDMSSVEFLSSAGVGSILGTVETSRQAGGDIILCNVHESIMHVLNVLDLAEYLTVKIDEHESLAACGTK